MEHDNDRWRFEGFSSPNFTSVPDEFFDVLAPRLNGGEVKAVLYIIRRTFGFKKDRDNISLSQMLNGIVKRTGERLDFGTGLSKPSLCRALKTLTAKDVIVATKQFDFNGGCVATSYQLRFRGSEVKDRPGAGEDTPGKKMRQGGESQKLTRGMSHNLTRPLVKKRDTQYTVNNIQLDNNVTVSKKTKKRSPLHDLNDIEQHKDQTDLIAADILTTLGDEHSKAFYHLVARKVPETVIRRTLSELKEGGAQSSAKVFTSRMVAYAVEALTLTQGAALTKARKALSDRFTGG